MARPAMQSSSVPDQNTVMLPWLCAQQRSFWLFDALAAPGPASAARRLPHPSWFHPAVQCCLYEEEVRHDQGADSPREGIMNFIHEAQAGNFALGLILECTPRTGHGIQEELS